jgi:hypothetical protein
MAVPDWIMKNKQVDFLNYFKQLFGRHYNKQGDDMPGDDMQGV